jgi:hypothetical protein
MSHALLSPSAAHRWLTCTPSARLEADFPDNAGEAAREGTLAHKYGETLIRRYAGKMKKAAFDRAVAAIQSDRLYTPDMQDYAEDYAVFVIETYKNARKRTKDALLLLEQRLDMTAYVPEGYGTGDAIVIADGVLHIIDLKYGKGVPVSCIDNPQMKLYALGALTEFDVLYGISGVAMTVYQPRLNNISTWETSAAGLLHWGSTELAQKAADAFDGAGAYVPGSHCGFCRAKTRCKALADHNLELARYEFADAALLADDEIADILARTKLFVNWIDAVNEYALAEAAGKGKRWDGFKLVEGRSRRIYLDEGRVAQVLLDNGYPEAAIYKQALLTITNMEKAITKKEFTRLLGDLVVKPQGKPALVPESDSRPPLDSSDAAAADFEHVLTAEGGEQ